MNASASQAMLERAMQGRPLKKRIVILDRSRVATREKCPKARFDQYHFPVATVNPNTGIATVAPTGFIKRAASAPLTSGIIVHDGLAKLVLKTHSEDEAVGEAIEDYKQTALSRGFKDEGTTPAAWIVREQTALTEAIIRLASRKVIPSVLKNFRIIAVEQEILAYLGEVDDDEGGVTFLWASRADLVTEHPEYNDMIIVWNWKTQKAFRDGDELKLKLDMQTAGEAYAAEQWWGRPVAGVQYVFFIKGEQREDSSKGHKVTYNHLIRAWSSNAQDDLSLGAPITKYAWAYYKPGSKSQVLSKSKPLHIHESYKGGVKQWIDDLEKGNVIPPFDADPLSKLIVIPQPVTAGPDKIERWISQTVRDEYRWLKDLDNGETPSRHEGGYACGTMVNNKCMSYEVCHEGADPNDERLYIIRDPNHPVESDLSEGDVGGGE